MSFPVGLRAEASRDAEEARDYFDAQKAGLGQDFIDRLNETLNRIGDLRGGAGGGARQSRYRQLAFTGLKTNHGHLAAWITAAPLRPRSVDA